MPTLSMPQIRALCRAHRRERGNICPIVGAHAAAETAMLTALERKGLIEYVGLVPVITDAGRVIARNRSDVRL
jgi:hypothetical protein